MPLSEADICNLALAKVGQKQFIAALDDASVQAACCNVLYAHTRDSVLTAFPWPFATKHATLALLDGVTRSGWTYVYAMPSGCLSPRYIFSGVRRGAPIGSPDSGSYRLALIEGSVPLAGAMSKVPFTTEANDAAGGSILLTDQPLAELVYTAGVTNTSAFPTPFIDALSWKLASELILTLPVKPALWGQMRQAFMAEFQMAGAAAFRESQEDVLPDAEHIAVRG